MNLQIGSPAPDFSANNQKGETLSIGHFTGKKLVLYFYPKDDTPGCTAEACSLRDNYQDLIAQGYSILGVSPDTEAKHQKFIDKYNLPFDLLADTDNAVALAYGVWVEKSMYGRKYMGIARTTFVIDEQGNLVEIIEKVDTKNHATQIIK
ncbi:MAG: thioredoxin-dependent thiol peroxidase [Bacteroidetes bacterium]|nr:thioredoxin-dependent thiol peroxidase [Bacteroidota bacterium]MDA1223632.1 thioredoxin-dependent thiol peroxidase [Bacteroidota bacterium]